MPAHRRSPSCRHLVQSPPRLVRRSVVIVQWCIKGLALADDSSAREIIDSGGGILCNWWRKVGLISPQEVTDQLTPANLDFHVNRFSDVNPHTGRPFSEDTPFISLSAGVVARDAAAQTNHIHRARQTALWFGTNFGTARVAYLYTCWMLVGPRAAVEVQGVAEEIRDLNTYRAYSPFQTEGEIAAKIAVPANQIRSCEKWEWDRSSLGFRQQWEQVNPIFTAPETLSNVRELI